ncbi:MAG: MOSC domain-containing protein [Salinivirgaceae bacterium]|nr:MOSC domain-containing protein [Salinivirgaceae bacterium]
MSDISVISVNISEKKGTIKTPRESITLTKNGIENDAHAGDWHRQISLLGDESIKKFEPIIGRKLEYGEFAENITTKGIVLNKTKPGDIFTIGDTILEVTQIGKKCHGDDCQIFREVGKCVMPKEGIFCKVIEGGEIKPGDSITYLKKE